MSTKPGSAGSIRPGLIESSDVAPASNHDVVALAGAETAYAPGQHRHYSNIGYRAVG